MAIEPYLFFEGKAEEAFRFYEKVLGAKLEMLMRYSDSPDKPPEGMLPPNSEHYVMHMSFTINGDRVMASDGGCTNSAKFDGFRLSYTVSSPDEAKKVFAALSDGAQEIAMPIGPTFFSDMFGMLTDKFGVGWMVNSPKS